MIEKTPAEPCLPPLLPREKALETLQREEYGYLPPPPDSLSFTEENGSIKNFCAGKASMKKVTATAEWSGKSFSFPFVAMIPKTPGPHPFFVHMGFDPYVPNRYLPAEEIIDNGFAVLYLYYKDITSDNADFTSGLAGVLYNDGVRGESDAGKIAMWAWATHRMLDYAQTLEALDMKKSAVCGHSRLGKTALLAAASDSRFEFCFSNDSGCSGAAITRGKRGETLENITDTFPYWFCENYLKYRGRVDSMPFDQHDLLGAIAPRYLYVASADEDIWADPNAEFSACIYASEAYRLKGLRGLAAEKHSPEVAQCLHEGEIGYHLRRGTHYLSREDWLRFIEFFRKKKGI